MYRKLLRKKFFRDNPYLEISAQRLVYSTLMYEGFEKAASEILLEQKVLSDERLEQITWEKKLIQSGNNPEMIFQFLRKNIDVVNRVALIEKALEFEEALLPMVIERLIRSGHDTFIENAVRLLARSKKDYSPLLKEQYDEVRSPYVQSLICVILGLRGNEDNIPWMMDRFFEMKRLYSGENYDQGPLLALNELNSRFYENEA